MRVSQIELQIKITIIYLYVHSTMPLKNDPKINMACWST